MKKTLLFLLFVLAANNVFGQDERYAKVLRDYPGSYEKETRERKYEELDNEYFVRIGTSKLNASLDHNGILTKERSIKLVGLLFRKNNLLVDEIFVEIVRDGEVIYSVTESCGENSRWKDFYIKLENIKYSENYEVIIYNNALDKKFIENRKFYIRKEVK